MGLSHSEGHVAEAPSSGAVETLRDVRLHARIADFIARNPNLKGKTSPKIAKIARDVLLEAASLARPVAYLRVEKVQKLERGKISFRKNGHPGVDLQVNLIANAFRHSEYAAAFICTIGKKVEVGLAGHRRKGDPLRTWLYDAAASYLTENLADQVQDTVARRYKGLKSTHRFSPGYCDWKLSEQKKLFRLFAPTDLEVTLSGSCMMTPRKSVSAIFGLGSKSSQEAVPCRLCRKAGCHWRRAGTLRRPEAPPGTCERKNGSAGADGRREPKQATMEV